ncbi:hypothetical protein K491DRAFT_686055 [Lophiostoma macrostomum CBS 122681]|uniref:Uncharacterized protein n=1 Tax=Lophiostoma macrostomum CBS 122681 TaxID=1314788 RepID=A0A6A6TUP5_9PLEO|nr:hypothetical protein K491DRAFT_686055 [Lophiostoma macrostomum CBS 122681]
MASNVKGKQPVRAASPSAKWVPKRETASNIDITEGLRSLILEDDPTPRSSSPATAKTPTRYTKQQPPRRKSGTSGSPERPRLRRKAATAPPGSLSLFSTKPHPPRRAISARAPRSGPGTVIRTRSISHRGPLLPRISLFGTPASRSLISKRKSSGKPVGRLGLKPKAHVWRMLPPNTLKKYELMSNILENRKSSSFSDRNRVKKTLKVKNLELLKTDIVDFKDRELPETPNSVVNTPRELYRTPDELPNVGSRRQAKNKKKLALHPKSAKRAKHFSLPLTPVIQERESLVMYRSPKQDLWKRNIYKPGPIRLADTSAAVSRRDSVATIDPFIGEVENMSKRRSDIAALDEIFMYFHEFGVVEPAAENGVDKFWIPKVKDRVQVTEVSRPLPSPSSKALRRLGLDGTPHSPRSPSVYSRSTSIRPPMPSLPSPSPSATLFPGPQRSFRLEDRQTPPASPSPRQRVGLRRLLGSASSIL